MATTRSLGTSPGLVSGISVLRLSLALGPFPVLMKLAIMLLADAPLLGTSSRVVRISSSFSSNGSRTAEAAANSSFDSLPSWLVSIILKTAVLIS